MHAWSLVVDYPEGMPTGLGCRSLDNEGSRVGGAGGITLPHDGHCYQEAGVG